VLGLVAVVSSALYVLSDVIEAAQGRFSRFQLGLTFLGEAAIPFVVLGLAAAQRPVLERFGRLAALAYAYAFAFFTGTVVFAFVDHTKDYAALTDQLGLLMLVHGAVMVVAGVGFGAATLRARRLPAWAAIALMVGVVLVGVTQNAPEPVALAAAITRALGIAGMGAAVMRTSFVRAGAPSGAAPDAKGSNDPGPGGFPSDIVEFTSNRLDERNDP
jgi:predicted membrane protein